MKMDIVIALVCLLVVQGEMEDDEWLDPYDMLNYDASTKTMRKPTEQTVYDDVPTKRREHAHDMTECSSKTDVALIKSQYTKDVAVCKSKIEGLQRELEEQKSKITAITQKPSCNPVFKRFLIKLLKEIERVGLPSDLASDVHYDAKIKLSRQALSEIRKLLADVDSWRTGALDDALSEILVDLKPHDYQAWRWHFEDTFGVEIDTVIKVALLVMIIVVIICSENCWSTVSWFVQFRRVFAICFFISIVWNWFYLYKIAFAEHQMHIVNMESINDKCTGVRKIDWRDNLKEWFRSTMTLQDDPCKRYYEVLMVNPILLVPPTKAISVTITTFITEPLKHVGQGISEFLRALLKDLPITLQIPVLLTIVLSILVFLYGSVQAAFQHGIMGPLRGGRRDDHAVGYQPQYQLRDADHDVQAGGDAGRAALPRVRHDQYRQERNNIRQRPSGDKRVPVETMRHHSREDEPDARERGEGVPETEQPDGFSSVEEGDLWQRPNRIGDEEETDSGESCEAVPDTRAAASSVSSESQTKDSQVKAKAKPSPVKPKPKEDSVAANSQDGQPSPTAQVEVQGDLAEGNTPPNAADHVETIGAPVQETTPIGT